MSSKRDLSVSMTTAGVYSLVFAVPLVLVLGLLYVLRWGLLSTPDGFTLDFGGVVNTLLLLVVFVVGVVVHEYIHALAWSYFGRKPLSAIKFGFQISTLTPYAHSLEPMEVNAYRLGPIMPALVLGILPSIIAILIGNGWLLTFGLFFTAAAAGDMLILWLIRNVKAGTLVEDHPTQAGCYVIES
jgi:Putative zincin peptidase